MALPSMTLAELRAAAQQRADMPTSSTTTFVTTAEWTSYINLSLYELYGLLVQKFGDDYYVKSTPQSISTDGTNDSYALATDFFKLLGVDLLISGSGATAEYVSLKPFTFQERNRLSGANFTFGSRTNLRYRLTGSKLWLSPFPSSGLTLRVHYVPTLTALSADADSFDGVSGWTEYIIVDAAIKAMQKEESDVSVLMAQKQALIQRIEAEAENRDAGSPARVADVRWNELGATDEDWR